MKVADYAQFDKNKLANLKKTKDFLKKREGLRGAVKEAEHTMGHESQHDFAHQAAKAQHRMEKLKLEMKPI
ncbi:MAG: hypothetical protein AAGJ35_16115 [Myxococcota bacterium]